MAESVQRGRIDLETVGPFDLQSTLESGQSYLWWREDGRDFADPAPYGGPAWYRTTTRAGPSPAVVRVRQCDDALEWESTIDADPILRRRLRLDDDLAAMRERAPDDSLVADAYDAFWGMRLVRDPPFATLVSFICSTQMRVERIHEMQQSLRSAFGTPVEFDGQRARTYPTPQQLAATDEATLRDLSLGYRAPYVHETAAMVAGGDSPAAAGSMEYEPAREWLTRYVGVGEKVADCVLLFSLGALEAVPLDTWIRSTIEEYYPECDRGSYEATSRAIRDRLGGDVAGYTQTYIFHYLRHEGDL